MTHPDAEAGRPLEERVREICLRSLERRMRSRRELERVLQRKGIDPEAAAPVLDRLAEVGLIDDEHYARVFVASRQRTRPRGSRGLAAELGQRGIAPEIVARILAEEGESTDPVETARRAVAPKLRSLSGRPPEEVRRKAEQFLLRRGFSYGEAKAALSGLETGDRDDA